MPEDERSSRRYSEKEVGLILRRATEFQRSEPSAADPTGLTLAELEEVASEVGIDPAYLRRAAAELEAGAGSGPWDKFLGGPLAFVLERTIPGEFPESRFEELVPLMQADKNVEWREDVFCEHYFNRYPDWHSVRNDRYKYAAYYDSGPYECLYDLQEDPDEFTNLTADPQHAETLSKMRKRLEWYRKAYPAAKQQKK